jgi:DNA-binding FadR family transcriptional regulator
MRGTKEAVEAVRQVIDAQPGSQSHLSERKNLDGDTAAWILIANLAAQTLPHLLGFLKDYLPTRQVKKIKIGDLEIENPTAEDLERFRALIDSRSRPETRSG